jgi:hypothetical protein
MKMCFINAFCLDIRLSKTKTNKLLQNNNILFHIYLDKSCKYTNQKGENNKTKKEMLIRNQTSLVLIWSICIPVQFNMMSAYSYLILNFSLSIGLSNSHNITIHFFVEAFFYRMISLSSSVTIKSHFVS